MLLTSIKFSYFSGEANVLQIFDINEGRKKVTVLGCRCTKGVLKRNLLFKVKRNDEIIFDGKLDSMRHLKNEVDSIKKDIECGLKLADLSDDVKLQNGDIVICYQFVKKKVETEWEPPGFA
jgi:translation initiation factor IF-2